VREIWIEVSSIRFSMPPLNSYVLKDCCFHGTDLDENDVRYAYDCSFGE
jgi:hypothetical protein